MKLKVIVTLISMCVSFNHGSDDVSCPKRAWYCGNETLDSSWSCPMLNAGSGSTCSYSVRTMQSTVPTLPLCNEKNPGRPINVKVSTYMYYAADVCNPALNITWQIPGDASKYELTGFILNVTGTFGKSDNPDQSKIRFFNLTSPPSNWQTIFYYDCFPVFLGKRYRIAIQSLPATYKGYYEPNVNVTVVNIPNSFDNDVVSGCTSEWTAPAIVAPSSSSSSISVTFSPAPSCYNFTAYNISLIDSSSGLLYIVVKRITVPQSSSSIYVEFNDVCPMIYILWIRPISLLCPCAGSDGCGCPVTEFADINMNRSTCTSMSTPMDDGNVNCGMTPLTTGEPPLSRGLVVTITQPDVTTTGPAANMQIIAGVIGALAALIAISVPVLVVAWIWTQRQKSVVLLIYSNEDNYHLDVVRYFAKFLESNANCQVHYCQPNGVDSSEYQYLLKWVHQKLQLSQYVIVLHTWASAQFLATSDTAAVTDTFQAFYAIHSEQHRPSSPSSRYQLINVNLPCCRSNSVNNSVFTGKAFQLMEEITDLVNVIGRSSGRFCRAQLTGNDASVIGDSSCHGIELLALKQAIVVCKQAEDSRSLNSYCSELTCCGMNCSSGCERQCCSPRGVPPILHFIPPDDGIHSETGTDNFEARINDYNQQYDADN